MPVRQLSPAELEALSFPMDDVEDFHVASISNKPRELLGIPIIIKSIRRQPTQNGDAAIIGYEFFPGLEPEYLIDPSIDDDGIGSNIVEASDSIIVKSGSPIATTVDRNFELNGMKRFVCKIGLKESGTTKTKGKGNKPDVKRVYFALYKAIDELPDLPLPMFGS